MDPLTQLLIGSGVNPGGAANPLLNPAGSQPTGAIPPVANPLAPQGAVGGFDINNLGKILSGVKAPESPAPKFSGGISGSNLPFLQSMPNELPAYLQASGAASTPTLPTLGQILAGAGGR
jgi:hypothetical protein